MHSPFVYNLVTQCFYDQTNFEDYILLKNYRKSLLTNTSKIVVSDLGAGSRVMKQKERHISNIAAKAGTSNKRAKLLYRLTNYLEPDKVLELGTSLGIATHAISLGNPKTKITSIEGCPATATFSTNQLKRYNINNVSIITGDFNNEIKNLKTNTYDLVFFDGNHQKEATLSYFESLLDNTNNNSVFIFDDIYWSQGMTEAWEMIKKHPKVTVTIDTFFWGFVFFRTEQAKEDFTIRI
ncbi:O-methyltransferase [Algibacter mikhailovii]|uniref:O-methyltransferase n=1 Tax=Algibacter mikhailovii TaxID=425498 RepID=A0A918V8C5_9FLAO|nr:O-methyltransferase [Algibacter mikhailovii]